MGAWRRPCRRRAPVAQSAEAGDLNSLESGFESQREHLDDRLVNPLPFGRNRRYLRGMKVLSTSWIVGIAIGLAYMLGIGLSGR